LRIALLDWVCDPDRPATSGLSDIVWDLARRLQAEGDEVTIVGAYDRVARPPTDIRLVRVDRPRAWQRNIVGQILTVLTLARATVRVPRPDVVFAPEYISIAALGLCYPRQAGVFTTPGNIFERITHGNPYDWSTTQVYKVAALTAARRAARIVALSQQMRYWWMRTGAPDERVAVIPLGVDLGIYRPLEGARARLGIPADEETVLYAGRFSIEKNVPTLIQAVAALAPRRPRLRLRLLGSGPDEAALRDLVARLGLQSVVTFVGWIPKDQVPDYYRAADVFTLPSTSEPLARTLLEAMACGTFVLSSASGGTPDVIRSGENGLMVDAPDVRAWEGGLERAFEQPEWRERLAERGRVEARERYNWPTITRRLREEAFGPAARLRASQRRPAAESGGRRGG
jgi:glycosyltransferase involved in cell wall biosynthesis